MTASRRRTQRGRDFEDSVVYSCHSGNVVYNTTSGSTLTTLLPPDSTPAYMTSFTRTCRADQTYTNTELACRDVNECDPDAYAAYTAATGNSAQQEQSFSTACQDACTNTIGSFECSCPAGFELQADGRSCDVLSCGLPPSRPFATVASQDQPRTYQQQALYTRRTWWSWLRCWRASRSCLPHHNDPCTASGETQPQQQLVLVDAQPIDFEASQTFDVTLACSDGNGGATDATFTLTVQDVNEPPTAIALSSTQAAEDVPVGSTVASIIVVDQDAGDTHNVTVASEPAGVFEAVRNPSTGAYALVLASPLDFETQDSVAVIIRAEDSAHNVLQTTITVSVLDANDPPSAVTLQPSSLNEHSAAGTVVGIVSATDQDDPSATTPITIHVLAGHNSGLFEVQPINTSSPQQQQQLVFVGAPDAIDFEVSSVVEVDVQAEDSEGGTRCTATLSTTFAAANAPNYEETPFVDVVVVATDLLYTVFNTFNITILNVNEPPYLLELSTSSVAENTPPGIPIATIVAFDEDRSGDEHTCQLLFGGDSALLSLLPPNTLTVAAGATHGRRVCCV
ncbi:hypothetical protein PTSG_01501 [Salpingoeca rosetta]|uniref:Cadherin domain-containing protein n=1 Tax=Salpingoeca rosetta (strain ATCC 50818 / BSB-021) TaxID=946362 RepID=F2U0I9_SALR5|nr:uncharacterized protein PTSG_01501 [Salpingoeca rosetta]EGD80917.1 hypothetical protein PTSG_01501 [Salpingoeca rosetta]|eukprot:XP_004997478.1 hypothetical protein PTSG_01501 [Salpingoeca rosetta]